MAPKQTEQNAEGLLVEGTHCTNSGRSELLGAGRSTISCLVLDDIKLIFLFECIPSFVA